MGAHRALVEKTRQAAERTYIRYGRPFLRTALVAGLSMFAVAITAVWGLMLFWVAWRAFSLLLEVL